MVRFQYHLFVCTNQRPSGHPKGCCASKGGEEIRAFLKDTIHQRGLHDNIRVNGAGCLGACEWAIVLVVYPDGVWYRISGTDDAVRIVDQHLVNGEVVKDLLIPAYHPESEHTTPPNFPAMQIGLPPLGLPPR